MRIGPKTFGVVALTLLGSARGVAAEPLPSDPSLVRGELENGLRYVIRRHDHPPGRAIVWLHVASGSLNETDRQRGIAHYLEHMAFNGSEHFPPGLLVPFFQSMGMTFGRDQNAFTDMEQTTYQLSLPDAKPETLGKGMTYFADVLTKLLLLPKEIESERQIILEERRRGLSGRQRTRDAVLAKISPGSLWTQRDTIGTEATIVGVVEKDFRDYYGAWYTASNATVLVVADADPAIVEKAIKDGFGAAPKRPKPVPQTSGVTAFEKNFAVVASDPEIEAEQVRITRLEPVRPPMTTVEQARDELLLELGEYAWNRRLEDKIARGGTSFVSASIGSGEDGRILHSWEVSARPAPGGWKPALEALALELQRARKFGFTSREIDDAKKQRLSGAERAVETEATAPAASIVRRLNGSLVSGDTVLAPSQRLDLLRKWLPEVTPEAVAKRFASAYEPKAVAFVAVLSAGPSVPDEAALLSIGTKALAVEPTKDAEVARATRLVAEAPKPGEVKQSDLHAATGVATAWLSNDVCVHHKFVDTQKHEVSVEIALVGADLLETAENRGVTSAAQVAWRNPATKALSSSDVRDLLTGKKVSVRGGGGGGRGRRGGGGGRGGGPGVAQGSVSLSVAGSPDDLETGFELAHLLLLEPRIEAAAFDQWKSGAKEALAEASKNPLAMGSRLAGSIAYPDDDVRLQPVTAAQIDRLTLEGSQKWLDRLVKDSPIEVTIVGDIPKERAFELAARWLGSLPARARVSPDAFKALRAAKRPVGPRRVERAVDTPTAQAFVYSGFYGPDETNRPEVRAVTLAAQILTTRLFAEVREKQQLVYSIGASLRAGSVFEGFGAISSSAPTEPHKAPALVDALAAVYAAFLASGPTDDELAVAKKQAAVAFDEQVKDPAYWSARIGLLTFRGMSLDDVAADPSAYQAITAKEVKDVLAKYVVPGNALVVVVKPAAEAKGADPAGGMEPSGGK